MQEDDKILKAVTRVFIAIFIIIFITIMMRFLAKKCFGRYSENR